MPNDPWQVKASKELLRLEEDTRLSAKGHYNASAAWGALHYLFGIPATAFSAAAAAATKLAPEWTLPCALLAAILAALLTFMKATEQAGLHKQSADEFLALNGTVRRMRELEIQSNSDEETLSRIQMLASKKDGLNRASPVIPWFAFQKARTGVNAGEAKYEADAK